MDRRPPAAPARTAFLDRRTTLFAWAVSVVAAVIFDPVYSASSGGTGTAGAAAAVLEAVAIVAGVLGWVGGIAVAARVGSFLWLAVAALLAPPGSIACALFCSPRRQQPPPRS